MVKLTDLKKEDDFRRLLKYLTENKKDELAFYSGVLCESFKLRSKELTIEDIKKVVKLDVISFTRRHNSIFYTYVLDGEEKEFKMNIYELILKLGEVRL